MYDYLVVGLGIAGMSFCETLAEHGKTFCVVNDGSQGASRVAGGLYNPVVLKRLKRAWAAEVQLPLVAPFYNRLQEKLGVYLHFPGTILRRFTSGEEQNQWFEAADTPALSPYLSPTIINLDDIGISAPWGFGEVLFSGRIDSGLMMEAYTNYLSESGKLLNERFDFESLECGDGAFVYGSTKATKIVFATGFGLLENPFFNYLPLQGNKGEYLEISCPGLGLENIVKAAVFIIPKGGDIYSVGATYDWRDTSPATTEGAREYLMQKLDALVRLPYRITGQSAGIRPTVPDRRPLLGEHPEISGMYVLNGYGSRGVMIAPYAASQLYGLIENGTAPEPEMDIKRYAELYTKPGRQPLGRNE